VVGLSIAGILEFGVARVNLAVQRIVLTRRPLPA
jgi:hypothetical protein